MDTRPRTPLISFCTVQLRTLCTAHSLATLYLFTTTGPDPGELPGFWGFMVFRHAPIHRKGSGKQQTDPALMVGATFYGWFEMCLRDLINMIMLALQSCTEISSFSLSNMLIFLVLLEMLLAVMQPIKATLVQTLGSCPASGAPWSSAMPPFLGRGRVTNNNINKLARKYVYNRKKHSYAKSLLRIA